MKRQLDFAVVEKRAKGMSLEALRYSRKDAKEAADAADDIEFAGNRVSKDGGYYRDEAGIYAAELRARGVLING